MRIQDIISNDVEYMKNVTVHIVSNYDTVTISDDNGIQDDIFLQGDDGSVFISEMESIWNELRDVTRHDVALHLAKPYVECIWN